MKHVRFFNKSQNETIFVAWNGDKPTADTKLTLLCVIFLVVVFAVTVPNTPPRLLNFQKKNLAKHTSMCSFPDYNRQPFNSLQDAMRWIEDYLSYLLYSPFAGYLKRRNECTTMSKNQPFEKTVNDISSLIARGRKSHLVF